MKYGAHCYIFTDRWADDQVDILDRVPELGLTGFDISVGDDVIFTPALTRQRAEALELDLSISPGGAWPLDCDLSLPAADDRRRGQAWHRRQVDTAQAIGATTYSGALYGHPGVIRRGPADADEPARIAEGLHELAAYGAERGVVVAIEPMSHFRTHVANTPDQIMDLVERADHPNLRVLLDTYHMVTEVRDYGAAIRRVGDRLIGLHACESDRGVPGGGLVPWAEVYAALHDIGFDGYVAFESYNSSLGTFARDRGMFHDVCADADAFIRRGLSYLREVEAAG